MNRKVPAKPEPYFVLLLTLPGLLPDPFAPESWSPRSCHYNHIKQARTFGVQCPLEILLTSEVARQEAESQLQTQQQRQVETSEVKWGEVEGQGQESIPICR